MMFDRVLIANRGEIAVRIASTCRRLDIHTIAVASDADRDALHVREADEVVYIGPAPATQSYLAIDRIVEAALERGAQAIHPGYGFLSESADLADAVTDAGLTFIGPSASVMRLMSDKAAAKQHLASAGVPILQGSPHDAVDDDALLASAERLGTPLIVKPVAGGGGKGMRRVLDLADLPDTLAAARREALAAFGDDRLMIEELMLQPRHVEVQVLSDRHGSIVHLLERECSIQRRHQKVVEECPSPVVDERLRARLGDAAVTAAGAVGYEGAGTIEFLLDAATLDRDHPRFAFLEMNTRLQVEHPVTELVTGIDLVEAQLRVAAGEQLGLRQEDVTIDGHAIEARLYAEDPVTHLPQTGEVTHLQWPHGPSVRVDAGVAPGSTVTAYYDPMLAKLIVHRPDRDQACQALAEALATTSLFGVTTNLELLRAIVGTAAFRSGKLTTNFLDDELGDRQPEAVGSEVIDAAARAWVQAATHQAPARDPFATLGPFRVGQVGGTPVWLVDGETEHRRTVRAEANGFTVVDAGPTDGRRRPVPKAERGSTGQVTVEADRDGNRVWIHTGPLTRALQVRSATRHLDLASSGGGAAFTAPMPGSVLAVGVAKGETVTAGTVLVVVEAMKMEHPIVAPHDGIVTDLYVRPDDRVEAGEELLAFADGTGTPATSTQTEA